MRTSAQTNQRHVSSITTKSRNIVSNPLKQHHLIPQPKIEQSFFMRQLRVQEPQCTNAVVEAHSHKRFCRPPNHTSCIVHLCSSTVKSSAMDVNHYGDLLAYRHACRTKDVGGQAIFRPDIWATARRKELFARTSWTKLVGRECFIAGSERLWFGEAKRVDRRLSVWDA
jgi:hypothetical protein